MFVITQNIMKRPVYIIVHSLLKHTGSESTAMCSCSADEAGS